MKILLKCARGSKTYVDSMCLALVVGQSGGGGGARRGAGGMSGRERALAAGLLTHDGAEGHTRRKSRYVPWIGMGARGG